MGFGLFIKTNSALDAVKISGEERGLTIVGRAGGTMTDGEGNSSAGPQGSICVGCEEEIGGGSSVMAWDGNIPLGPCHRTYRCGVLAKEKIAERRRAAQATAATSATPGINPGKARPVSGRMLSPLRQRPRVVPA